MVVVKMSQNALASLQAKHRRVLSTKTRSDLFYQARRQVVHKLTPEERKGRNQRRKNDRDKVGLAMAAAVKRVRVVASDLSKKLGGSLERWHRKLMQNARIARARRKPNRWNAFLSKRLEEINTG